MDDTIIISGLEVMAHIGITEEERRIEQRLLVSITLTPFKGFEGIEDEIERTIDYVRVAEVIQREARAIHRSLIETMTGDIINAIMAAFPVKAVEVELRKFVLPGTEYVAVRMRRDRGY